MTLLWHSLIGSLLAQRVALPIRTTAAWILMFVIVTGGLLLVNAFKRYLRRYSDLPPRPRPYESPPVDDWARKPLVDPAAEIPAESALPESPSESTE